MKYLLIIIIISYTYIVYPEEALFPIKIENNYGYINNKGNTIIKPQYAYADKFSDNRAVVGINNKFGFISSNGSLIYPITLDYAMSFHDGFALIGKNNDRQNDGSICDFYYIDHSGKIALGPYKNSRCFSFSEGLAAIETDLKEYKTDGPSCGPSFYGNWNFINKKGEFAIKLDPAIKSVRAFSGGLAVIYKNNYNGYINTSGNIIIEPKYRFVTSFNEGYAVISNGFENSIIDQRGNVIIKYINAQYEIATDLNGKFIRDGIFILKSSGLSGFVNLQGNRITRQRAFYPINLFHNGYAAVCFEGKWGYINFKGDYLIEPSYKAAFDFENGLAKVIDFQDNEYYININGTILKINAGDK